MTRPEFSDEEMLRSAQFVANFWLLATMAYLKKNQLSIVNWVRFGSVQVVQGYSVSEPVNALVLARDIALGPVSLGGDLIYLRGNEDRAAVAVNFPAEEMLTAFGLTLDDFDLFIGSIYETLATSLGMKHLSRRTGQIWTWRISRL